MVCAIRLFPPATAAGEGSAARPSIVELQADLPSLEVARSHVIENRYLVEELLHYGALGVTYEAYDIALDAPVWIQFLHGSYELAGAPVSWNASPWDAVRHALNELAGLRSPHLVESVGRGVLDQAWPFIVSGPARGETLRQWLAVHPGRDLSLVLRIGRQLAAGLQAAHGVGVLHGALTSEQIRVHGDGAQLQAQIAGCGLFPMLERQRELLFAGGPELRSAAPEVFLSGQVEERSDVYALGAILYEVCTGVAPFAANDPSPPSQRVHEFPEPPSARLGSQGIEWRVLDQILRRCLAPLPEQRYASAGELGYDVARLERAWAKRVASEPLTPPAPSRRAWAGSVQAHSLPKRRAITRIPKVLLGPGIEPEQAICTDGASAR